MPIKFLDAAVAFANRKRGYSSWAEALPDESGYVWPSIDPSFSILPGASIFTIGSCFARNIEDAMAAAGFDVPMVRFKTRLEEWEGRPSSMLNKFTPPNFKDSMEWAAAVFDKGGKVTADDCKDYALDIGNGSFLDIDTASQIPVTFDRLLERRQEIYDVFRSAFSADVIVLTPGYVESWLDNATGKYLAGVLKLKRAFREGRFVWQFRGVEESLSDMLDAIDCIRQRNPKANFLVTASPVPLGTTFSGQDVRVANTLSKSIVRTVCGLLPNSRERCDYFPTYESAMLSDPSKVWKPDRIHILQPFINNAIARLKASYSPAAAVSETA